MVKVLFGLPLPQITGMVSSILEMAGLEWRVPELSTLNALGKPSSGSYYVNTYNCRLFANFSGVENRNTQT